MIDEINHDSTGYWVNIEKGFYSPSTGCHTIHETSQKAVLAEIRKIQAETYDLKDEDGAYIEENMTFEEAVECYKMIGRKQDMHSRQTGDSVEKLWDAQDLQRDASILFDEAVEDLVALSNKLEYDFLTELEREQIIQEREEIREYAHSLQSEILKDIWFDIEEAYAGNAILEVEQEITQVKY